MQLDRHHLAYLEPKDWPGILQAYPEALAIPIVAGWIEAGNPLIARRPVCADTGLRVGLGLPLPPSLGKQRIAIEVAPESVMSTSPPPLITQARMAAPPSWHETLDALIALDARTRCFGSLAWASLTGLDYLSETSDLDLLWSVKDRSAADSLLEALVAIDAKAPMRLDGEFVTPGGMAVQWREWAGDAPEMIAKSADGVRLIARESLFT